MDENNEGHSSEYYITPSVKQESVYWIYVACIGDTDIDAHTHTVCTGADSRELKLGLENYQQ